MLLIYWKNKVGSAVADLCIYLGLDHEIRDDSDGEIDLTRYEQIIPSPWVPGTHLVYQTGKVIAELDFAYQYLPKWCQIVSVTGTDGKSTTTWMIYNILQKEYFGKKKVYLSGNFEIPFSATVLDILRSGERKGIIVVEVSSFMSHALRWMDNWGYTSDYSIFTNLKPDHLNWHRDLQEYADAKMNLMKNTRKKAIINSQVIEFIRMQNLILDLPTEIRIFSQDIGRDSTDGERIIISGRRRYLLSETQFSGMHNALNILSVWLVANEMKICSKRMKKYYSEISGLPHRIELVIEKNGVKYIDDSKSTSCQSLMAALSAFPHEHILLIAGGSDKGDTFDGLEESLRGVKQVVLFGATREIMAEKCDIAHVSYTFAESMDDAVQQIRLHAKKDDVVLLSPGCASFGLFRDYLDRATKFREAVEKYA